MSTAYTISLRVNGLEGDGHCKSYLLPTTLYSTIINGVCWEREVICHVLSINRQISQRKCWLQLTSLKYRKSGRVARRLILESSSVAQKMSWAAGRHTSRIEDVTYSLLGLFNVNMPLIYDEGNKAFQRLQQEIIRSSDDGTILAWADDVNDLGDLDMEGWMRQSYKDVGFLAFSPAQFRTCGSIRRFSHVEAGGRSLGTKKPFFVTNKGIQFDAHIIQIPFSGLIMTNCMAVPLNCTFASPISNDDLPLLLPIAENGIDRVYDHVCGPIQLTACQWLDALPYTPKRQKQQSLSLIEQVYAELSSLPTKDVYLTLASAQRHQYNSWGIARSVIAEGPPHSLSKYNPEFYRFWLDQLAMRRHDRPQRSP